MNRTRPDNGPRYLTIALNLDRALDRARDRDRALTDEVALNLDLDRALDRAAALGHARDLARDLARTGGHNFNVTLARDFALDLDHDLDFALARVRDLTLALDHASRVSDLMRAHDLGRALVDDLANAAQKSNRLLTGSGTLAEEPGPLVTQPLRMAVGLLERVVRVLPAADRPRYRQEYLAELHALAQEQAPRRTQLGHVLRAATTMWALRQALSAPRPGRERVR